MSRYNKIHTIFMLLAIMLAGSTSAQPFKNINVAEGLCNSVVKCFAQDEDGFMWMGTFNGLCRYDGFGFTTYRHIDDDTLSIKDNHIEALLPMRGKMLVGTSGGLNIMDAKNRKFSLISLSGNTRHYITRIKEACGKVFVADVTGRMWYAESGKLDFKLFKGEKGERILDVVAIDNCKLAFLTDQRIFIADAVRNFKTLSSTPVRGLPSSWNTIHFSRNLNIIILASGIGYPTHAYTVNAAGVISPESIWLPPNVKSVCDYKYGTVFATDGEGLYTFYDINTRPTHIIPNNHFAIHSLFVDRNENLWAGTYRNGFEISSNSYNIFSHYDMQSHRLTQNVVTAICVDDGFIYAGIDGGGLNIIDHNSGNTTVFTTDNSNIPGNNVMALIKGTDCLYLAIYGKGVCRFHFASGKFEPIVLPDQQLEVLWILNKLDDNKIVAIGNKVNIIDQKTGKVLTCRPAKAKDKTNRQKVSITQHQDISEREVQSAIADAYGNIWAGTDNGLYCQPRSSKGLIKFGHSDKLPSVQFCKNACSTDGRLLYFGTTDGIIIVNPSCLITGNTSDQVSFNGIDVLKDNISISAFGRNPDKVTLAHDQNFFKIKVSVPEFIFPDRIKFRYRLEGIDKQWRTAVDTRDIEYTNIPHGNYNFQICTTDSIGNWSENLSELNICVLPPWYLTWWAKAIWLSIIVTSAILVFREWNNRQKLRYELQKKDLAREMEHRVNEEKMNFFAGVTHELRTPMFLITAPLEELLDSPQRPVQMPYSYLRGMYRNAMRLNKLINRILDMHRMPEDSIRLTLQRRDLVKTCRRLSLDFRALCQQKRISFRFETSLQSLIANVDNEKMELMLSNIVTNAYKYTPEGGEVTLTLNTDGNIAILDITDNGIGISEEKQKLIFDPYYRADNVSTVEGTGTGLSFVSQLVKAYGGYIFVRSEKGKGSTFTLHLPLRPNSEFTANSPLPVIEDIESSLNYNIPASEDTDNADDAKPVHITNPMALRTMLIVDDEESLSEMLAHNMSKYYNVITANSGYEGIKIMQESLPDIVVCDIMMPGMDGIEFLEIARADKKLAHIPIIMLTAKSFDDDRIKALEKGADAYLTKPTSLKVLKAHADRLLKGNAPTLSQTTPLSNEKGVKKSNVSKQDELFILQCKEIIDTHLEDQSIDVIQLAKLMNMSQSALYKRIKAITGGSTADLILDYKIFKATSLFKAGETNITSVAYKCGFNGIHPFRTAFKQRMGMPPSQYIKEM